MKRNSWMDLTPLLDIFLILLFAVLINQTVGQRQLEGAYASELDQIKSKNTQLALELETVMDQVSAVGLNAGDERVKYDFLVEKVLVLDVELRSIRNQIFIDHRPTGLYLVDQPERRDLQISAIRQALDEELQRFSGEVPMCLVTLKADTSTYRYAYLMALEAIKEWTGANPLPKTYFIQLN